MCGIMDLTGEPDGEPSESGRHLDRRFTGYGVIGALAEREPSGLGQHVDLALLDVGAAVLANQAMNYHTGGGVPRRMGDAHPDIGPHQVFPASDGHLIITWAMTDSSCLFAICLVSMVFRMIRPMRPIRREWQTVKHSAPDRGKTELRPKAELSAGLEKVGGGGFPGLHCQPHSDPDDQRGGLYSL
jgi:crotonobetainyl-CoA:carnitine CoA-transferase CaiB-like acyl-CoA transferase